MATRKVGALVLVGLLAACSAPQAHTPAAHRPQQAGQPMAPVRVAAHML